MRRIKTLVRGDKTKADETATLLDRRSSAVATAVAAEIASREIAAVMRFKKLMSKNAGELSFTAVDEGCD